MNQEDKDQIVSQLNALAEKHGANLGDLIGMGETLGVDRNTMKGMLINAFPAIQRAEAYRELAEIFQSLRAE